MGPSGKGWYAPRPGMEALDRWQARPDVPNLLPGEDRDFGSGLFVDLVQVAAGSATCAPALISVTGNVCVG
jgi:hypothetical protein